MPLNELELPAGAIRTPDADEILRVFINGDKNMDLVLKRGFNDAATWGTLLADVARHLAIAYQDMGDNPHRALERIRDTFVEDLARTLRTSSTF